MAKGFPDFFDFSIQIGLFYGFIDKKTDQNAYIDVSVNLDANKFSIKKETTWAILASLGLSLDVLIYNKV